MPAALFLACQRLALPAITVAAPWRCKCCPLVLIARGAALGALGRI